MSPLENSLSTLEEVEKGEEESEREEGRGRQEKWERRIEKERGGGGEESGEEE